MSTATSFRIATPDLTNRWITPQGHAEASCHNCTTTVRASDEGWYHPGTGQARCPREALIEATHILFEESAQEAQS